MLLELTAVQLATHQFVYDTKKGFVQEEQKVEFIQKLQLGKVELHNVHIYV